MKWVLGLIALISSFAFSAPDPGCAKVNPAVTDSEGTPMCPGVVAENTAFSIFRCAVGQARSWHEPTKGEISSMHDMLREFKAHNYPAMRASADKLGLQTCRVIKGDDKYIVFFTKYGVNDYNGTFMMLRDSGKASKVWLIAPHTNSDGYHSAAPRGFQESSAFAYFQNGHPKGGEKDRKADFSHSKSTLGYLTVRTFGQLYPKLVVLHIHGMAKSGKVLYRPLEGPLAKHYERAIRAVTNIERFEGFNAYYEIDPPTVNTGWYVKTEIPAAIYKRNDKVVANIIKHFEKEKFAWDDMPDPIIPPEPAGSEVDPDEAFYAANIGVGPEQEPAKGLRDLLCVAIDYSDGQGAKLDGCKQQNDLVKEFYEKQSRGMLKFKTKAIAYRTSKPKSEWKRVEQEIKSKFDADLYIIPNLWRDGASNAGGKIAHLTQMASGRHEVGHLLGLGHAGAYKKEDGTIKFDDYGDGTSVMSRFFTGGLTAPQYYHLAWIPTDEALAYEAGKTYTLKRINAFNEPGASMVVVSPRDMGHPMGPKARYAFISFPIRCDACLTIHLSNGGGSQKVTQFANEFYDPEFTGLHIKRLGFENGKVTFQVNIGPNL